MRAVRLVATLLTAYTLIGCNRSAESEPIYLGHLAALTGAERTAGAHAKQGILLAVEEVNQTEQFLHGRRVVFLHADTRGSAETAQQEAVRLIKVNSVLGMLGDGDPFVIERVGKVAQQYCVAFVSQSGGSPPLREGVVSVGLASQWRGQVLARFAAEELKAANVFVIQSSGRPDDVAVADAFDKAFPRGDKRSLESLSAKEEKDQADLIARIKKAQPHAIAYAGDAVKFNTLCAKLREAGIQAPLLYGGEDDSPARTNSDAAGVVYMTTAFAPDADVPAAREFVTKYQQRFHEAPDVHAALAYDGARLLFEALRRTTPPAAAKVREELLKVDSFNGVTGPMTFTDRTAHRLAFVIRLEGGSTNVVRKFDHAER